MTTMQTKPLASLDISDLSRKTFAGLSKVNERFLRYVESHPELLERSSFPGIDDLSPLQPYPLQPWPTFVSPQTRAEVHRVNLGLTRLVRQIPERIFGFNHGRLQEFYDLEDGEAETLCRLMKRPGVLDGTLARGDFFLTESGFQCLECNVTGNLGGSASVLYSAQCLTAPALRNFFSSHGIPPRLLDTEHQGLLHVLRHTLAHCPCPGGVINLVHLTPPQARLTDQVLEHARGKYRDAVAEVGANSESRIFLVPYSGLEVDSGRVTVGAEPVHAIVEGYVDRYPEAAVEQAAVGEMALFNGPLHRVLDDKRNLALLSAAADGGELSPTETALVRAHCPWTRIVVSGTTQFQACTVLLEDLLRDRGADFVLKPAKGLGGEGVVIGAHVAQVEWEDAVDRALAEKGRWVAQKLVEPLPLPYQSEDLGCCDHAVVWGIFALGSAYGGGYLRVQPTHRKKPVNQSQGAVTACMFEAEE